MTARKEPKLEMTVKQRILELLRDTEQTPDEIIDELKCTKAGGYLSIKELFEVGLIVQVGESPKGITGKTRPIYTSNYDKMSVKVYQANADFYYDIKEPTKVVPFRDPLVAALFGEPKLLES